MHSLNNTQRAPPLTSAGLDYTEEILAEADEPPDEPQSLWSPPVLNTTHSAYSKAMPQAYNRRESLLTRQLHSETEHTEDEGHHAGHSSARGLSMASTWSNPSATSTAELTSDDGGSVASPAISPPLPPTHVRLPILEKPLTYEPKLSGRNEQFIDATVQQPEKAVEVGLGRRRCITFACGGRKDYKPAPPKEEPKAEDKSSSPPKRKCMLKFACPSRPSAEAKPVHPPQTKRQVSPPPPQRKASSPKVELKAHRGSDSTVTQSSPKSVRKSTPSPPQLTRKLSETSEPEESEAIRFHEFATSDAEPEEWTEENTVHRTRLTVSDTLKKENAIRQLGEEVEEEALEDDEQELEDDADDVVGQEDEDEDALDEDADPKDKVRAGDASEADGVGYSTDDEEGFANSDSEDDGSDNEWWTPAALSTAPTSAEHLDILTARPQTSVRITAGSSVGSASSGHMSPRTSRHHFHSKAARKSRRIRALPMNRPIPPELPDSTDFVCGTLDEDRPLEAAYISCIKEREKLKHLPVPQDIDPTFPTSDPDMDEEDDEDIEDPPESGSDDDLMHGAMDELHGPRGRKKSPLHSPRPKHNVRRSPAPPTKHRSPPPAKRNHYRSPPPANRRIIAKSPPPHKLFNPSPPQKLRSPPPNRAMMTSPPNSPTARTNALFQSTAPGLAHRPQLTHTASLPRGGLRPFLMTGGVRAEEDDDTEATTVEMPKRGAIDIVKGLEHKRQRRKEKLYQKHCNAKAAAKDKSKEYKVRPGRGAERMREVGLELARYRGKGEHILSI